MKVYFSIVALSIMAGCSTAPSEPSETFHIQSSGAALAVGASGFQADPSKSHFALGMLTSVKQEFGMTRYVGSEGVITKQLKSGMLLAVPNADAPARRKAPFVSADAHDAFVKNYFVQLGLPTDQIDRVQIMAAMTSTWREGEQPPDIRTQAHLDGYYSDIHRKVAGVRVPESEAWAMVNVDNEIVSERVYWPELPAQVVSDAAALSAAIQDPVSRTALRAKLVATDARITADVPLEVVIHHTPGEWRKDFSARAVLDVTLGNAIVHLGLDGAKIELPEEKEDPTVTGTPRPTNL